MKTKRVIVALGAAAALVAGAPATAAPKESAEILGTVVLSEGGNAATVSVRYVCKEPTHLWVSAKQAADAGRDPRLMEEGSSQHAAAWLQNHPQLDCDGRSHVQSFKIDNYSEFGFGKLRKGNAWVQVCLTRGETEEDFELVAYPARWAQVR